ncbi:hypothetical protein BDW67DRAFT_184072 [Aspergillus spinulosporus]
MFGSNKEGPTTDCITGNKAYCCSGRSTSDPDLESRGTTIDADQTAKDFDADLTKFLENPVAGTLHYHALRDR